VCGGIFVVVTAAMFTMTVVRRPSVAWLKLLRGVAIVRDVSFSLPRVDDATQ
jgi:hypothetical protein